MSGNVRFSSTKLVVHDLEATRDFYCDAYGFVERGRIQADMLGEPIDEFLLGRDGEAGVPLMLVRYVERDPPPVGREVVLVFTTTDLDALVERVVAAGGRILREPYVSQTTNMRAAFTADPEGHVIENVELGA